jgi:hypothetical protein
MVCVVEVVVVVMMMMMMMGWVLTLCRLMYIPVFCRNILSLSLELWYLPMNLHGATKHKAIIFAAVRT